MSMIRWVPDITIDRLTMERGKDQEIIDSLKRENLAMREAIRTLLLHSNRLSGNLNYAIDRVKDVDALAAFLDGMPAKIGRE